MTAARYGGASRVGSSGLAALGLLALAGCPPSAPREAPRGVATYTSAPPSESERYCAWFGDRRDGTLYFGESAFWWALRRSRSPLGDLEHPGPVRIGRFDLGRERLLDALLVGEPGDRAGVWDVLVHPEGRVFFTRYFEPAGWVDLESGEVRLLPDLGLGLNELTLAPYGRVLVSRYPIPDGPPGSVLVLDARGERLAEHPIPAPEGYVAGPKTVGFDPRRGHIWVSMDWLPMEEGSGRPIRYDAVVLDRSGKLLRRIESPHLHFPAFGPDGTAYLAEVADGELWLRVVPGPEDPLDPASGRRVMLDRAFPESVDFAQEVRPLPGGGAVVTRWSGQVHLVDAEGRSGDLLLPDRKSGGLYYTGVLHEGRICTTYCADVSVVCADAPTLRP